MTKREDSRDFVSGIVSMDLAPSHEDFYPTIRGYIKNTFDPSPPAGKGFVVLSLNPLD